MADVARLQDQIVQRRRRAQAQIEALQADLEADEAELRRMTQAETVYQKQSEIDAETMARSRGVNSAAPGVE